MDILAARKRAAERAKTVKAPEPAPAEPAAPALPAEQAAVVPERREPEEPAFPPLPDTSFLPDEPPAGTEPAPLPSQEGDTAERPGATAAAASAPAQEEQAKQETQPPPEAIPAAGGLEPDAPEQPLEMLAFLLGREEYVVPVDQVREILKPREITPVPHTAEYLLGVCSLRGTVMPVIDLNRRLGLAASERDERSRIIVASLGADDQVGLFADRVSGVVRFLPSAVRPAPETVAQGAGAEFLKGIARKDERLYILLDVEKAVGT